ncbi:glycoside hydrolase family 114 protein [Piromyces sp. E2]|nr:glycoside hydrolase family 114 protein [Piromyces sp. E2]|eukprot:OUM59392.1 glycoside hydrolase family 114 protein [Piromyces sp. E2]
MVPILHKRGQKAVCYFSGGTTEKYRPDKKDYEKAGVIVAYKYGCDAVEVDCLDIHYSLLKKYNENDVFTFAKWVAETGHEENISVGLKNVATISEKLQPYFDFAVVESCAESPNVCNYYKAFTNNNKAVFIVHYGNRGWKLSGNKFKTLKKEQGGRKFTCVISNDQDLKGHTKNYNCDTGAEISNYSILYFFYFIL